MPAAYPKDRPACRGNPSPHHLPCHFLQTQAGPVEIPANAGVQLDHTYPKPIVSLGISREVALAAYARMREK